MPFQDYSRITNPRTRAAGPPPRNPSSTSPSPPPPAKVGKKQGWDRLWAVLAPPFLYLYTGWNHTTPVWLDETETVDRIDLRHESVLVRGHDVAGHEGHLLKISTQELTRGNVFLRALNQEEMKIWLQKLKAAREECMDGREW